MLGYARRVAGIAIVRYRPVVAPALELLSSLLKLVATFEGSEGRTPGNGAGVSTDTGDASTTSRWYSWPSYAELIAEIFDETELISPTQDEDVISLALTSGTTGTPKGALQSQRMMIPSTVISILSDPRVTESDYAGLGFLLPACAAAFLSTVIVSVGRFHIWGTVADGLAVVLVAQGLLIGGLPFTWTDLINGAVLSIICSLVKGS